ncbi:MAG: hypothetical protein V1701_02545 [Planctomycetota bacterium]
MKRYRRVNGNKAAREMREKINARVQSGRLLDAFAREFVYLAKNNPRVSRMVRRGNTMVRGFTTEDFISFIFPFLTSPEYNTNRLIKRCHSLDRNFIKNWNKFNKLCGNKNRINPVEVCEPVSLDKIRNARIAMYKTLRLCGERR